MESCCNVEVIVWALHPTAGSISYVMVVWRYEGAVCVYSFVGGCIWGYLYAKTCWGVELYCCGDLVGRFSRLFVIFFCKFDYVFYGCLLHDIGSQVREASM